MNTQAEAIIWKDGTVTYYAANNKVVTTTLEVYNNTNK